MNYEFTAFDTSISDSGGGEKPPCELQELPIFPQGALSMAQGFNGVRRWYLKVGTSGKTSLDVLTAKVKEICNSHWPWMGWDMDLIADSIVPVSVQWGSVDDKVNVEGIDSGESSGNAATDSIASFDQYLIVAQYQLLHISDPWAIADRPAKPQGTVLALQVRGGGEILHIRNDLVATGNDKTRVYDPNLNSRIVIPLTEYHIICDRIKETQLCNIWKIKPWTEREGTVNMNPFLNEPEGCMLFDTWTLEPTFAPDPVDTRRWRLTCVLKSRHIPEALGIYPDADTTSASYQKTGNLFTTPKYPVGWNHEYCRTKSPPFNVDAGWSFVMMSSKGARSAAMQTPHGTCPDGFVPRYPYTNFDNMFCDKADDQSSSGYDPAKCDECDRGCWHPSSTSDGSVSYGCPPTSSTSSQATLAQIIAESRGVQARKLARDGSAT